MTDDSRVLDVQGLTRHFKMSRRRGLRMQRSTVKAVDRVDLHIDSGETVGLVGESGCGKSTLARLVMGLDSPTAGTATINGRDVFARSHDKSIRRDAQIVLQDPYSSLDPRMTVGDIVAEPFEIHPSTVPRSGRRAAVHELFELVGLDPNEIDRFPHQFSGGQRQRIGIARALALRPKLIICDEPVSALDVSVQAQVINLLKDLQDELGLSYLFISHDLSVVRHVAHRVYVMYLGRIVEAGTFEEILDHPTHPYTQALRSAVPAEEPSRDRTERIILSGEVPSPLSPPSGCAFHTRCWKATPFCSQEAPALEPRSGSEHPSACHFAGRIEKGTNPS